MGWGLQNGWKGCFRNLGVQILILGIGRIENSTFRIVATLPKCGEVWSINWNVGVQIGGLLRCPPPQSDRCHDENLSWYLLDDSKQGRERNQVRPFEKRGPTAKFTQTKPCQTTFLVGWCGKNPKPAHRKLKLAQRVNLKGARSLSQSGRYNHTWRFDGQTPQFHPPEPRHGHF